MIKKSLASSKQKRKRLDHHTETGFKKPRSHCCGGGGGHFFFICLQVFFSLLFCPGVEEREEREETHAILLLLLFFFFFFLLSLLLFYLESLSLSPLFLYDSISATPSLIRTYDFYNGERLGREGERGSKSEWATPRPTPPPPPPPPPTKTPIFTQSHTPTLYRSKRGREEERKRRIEAERK